MIRRLVPLLALAALVGAGCAGAGASTAAGGNPTDRAFAAAMVPHHEAAVAMADVALRRASDPFVRELAAEVRRGQTAEIRALRTEDRQLASAGVRRGDLGLDDAGMATGHGELEAAADVDATFLRLMIPHHEGALAMAKLEIARGTDPELKRLAERIVANRSREIERMRARL